MQRQHIPFPNLKSIADVALVRLGLNGPMFPLSLLACAIGREGLAWLPSVVFAAWRASPMVKKLERLEMTWLRILHRLPCSNGLLRPRNSAYNLPFRKL